MGDVKKKSSTKNTRGKSKKSLGKSKNYIQENVKKLRQMQNERPKPQEDKKVLSDHPISYAERLKAVTSPHIKMIQKLSMLKDKSQQVINGKKRENEPSMAKAKLSQTIQINVKSQPSLQIKLKKPPLQPLTKRNFVIQRRCKSNTVIKVKTPQKPAKERKKRKFEISNDVAIDAKDNKNIKETVKISEIVVKDCNEFTNKNNEVDKIQNKTCQEGNYKTHSQVYYSVSQTSKFSKGFKNEGCQVKPTHSFESVNSTAVVRFPRTNNTMNQSNKNVCEKSLQTEINSSKQSSPISKYRNRSPKKCPIVNKLAIPPTEGKKLENQRSNLSNNQLKKFLPNSSKVFPASINTRNVANTAYNANNSNVTLDVDNKNKVKQKNNKNRLNPVDDKANRILNNIISASNFDIKKLYNEIARVQKTSPFARHHTVFEKRSPEEIKKEHDSFMKNNPNRDPGAVVLPDHKRREYLAQIKKRHSDLLQHLNTMPVNTKSSEARLQKLQLGKALDSMDSAIKLFSKNHLLIDLNSTTTN